MIILGWPEVGRWNNLRDDRTRPLRLRFHFRALGDLALLLVVVEDRGTVLRPAIVSLLIHRRRIVESEEKLQDLVVADLLRIEFDLDRLRVACAAGFHIFVPRIRERAAGVADVRVDHAVELPDHLLHAPEASAGERGLLGHLWASCFLNSGRYFP